jgi:hypothetical protein
VSVGDLGIVLEACESAGRADQRQLASQPVRAELHAESGGRLQGGVRHGHRADPAAGRDDALAQASVLLVEAGDEGGRVPVEAVASAHDFDAGRQVLGRLHLDREAKSVEELRPELALFGISGADQHEAGRVPDAETFALDHVLARRRHVEEEVDEVVLEKIGLVDVEKAAMGAGEKAGLERLDALGQRPLEVERAHDPVLRRPERQVDDRNRDKGDLVSPAPGFGPALVTDVAGLLRSAIIGTACNHPHAGQKRRERANRRRFAGPPIAEDENATDTRVDGGDHQGELHLVLSHDRRERKRLPHHLPRFN